MSVDIHWDLITSGIDGEALAATIRDFIHTKFQQIALPRFISAVHVHSFEFGSVCPSIVIQDVCDPLPDFYEDEEEDDEEDSPRYTIGALPDADDASASPVDPNSPIGNDIHPLELHSRVAALQTFESGALDNPPSLSGHGLKVFNPRQGPQSPAELLSGPSARSGTPVIPGGTSNMNYFHFPIGGHSGAQTPLAAVAGGGPFATHAWLRDQQAHHASFTGSQGAVVELDGQRGSVSVRPRTAGSVSSPELGSPLYPSSPEARPIGHFSAEKVSDDISSTNLPTTPAVPLAEKVSASDLQVVAQVKYNGDIKMMLTAEIMLDYPMPSFIKIPLKLSITGLSFDGVAILAYIKKKMHFCFLDPEDAATIVGCNEDTEPQNVTRKNSTMGSLLREIQVETEIGQQENGKQVLKNVSKVERFVLEQVRRIFEEEFVFPSFWTFLV